MSEKSPFSTKRARKSALGLAAIVTGGLAYAAVNLAPPAGEPLPVQHMDCDNDAALPTNSFESSSTFSSESSTSNSTRVTITVPSGIILWLDGNNKPSLAETNDGQKPNCSDISESTLYVYNSPNATVGHLVTSLVQKKQLEGAMNLAASPSEWEYNVQYNVSNSSL